MQADQLTTHRISPGLMHTGVDPVQVLHRSAVALNFQHQAPDIRIGISPPDFTQLILCHGLEGGQIATVHVHGRGLTTVWIYTILSGCRRDFIRQFPLIPAFSRQPSMRSEEHTSELQSRENLVCRLLLEKKKKKQT